MSTGVPTAEQNLSVPQVRPEGFALRLKNQRILNRIFYSLTWLCAFFVFILLFAMLGALFYGAWPALKHFGLDFFFNAAWDPVAGNFGALIPIYGTLVTSFIALLIAVPISFGIALFLTELSPRVLVRPLGIAIELLAAVPSIIYGMWGLFVFAPFFAKNIEPWLNDRLGPIPLVGPLFQGPPMGIGMLTAGLILAIMVIPFISSVMRDVLEVVPPLLKESSYGLGATTWETTWQMVLPYTRVGVIGAIMLGLGRALGETMAVTFVIGNAHDFSKSLLLPGNTISSALANEFTEAVGDLYTGSLISLGLVLFIITLIVLASAKLLILRLKRRDGMAT